MSFDPNYKDTYVKLDGEAVLLDSKTVVESKNPVHYVTSL